MFASRGVFACGGLALLLASATAGGACSSTETSPVTDGGLAKTEASTPDAAKPSLCIDGKPAPYPTDTKIDLFGTLPPLELPLLGGGKYSLASRFEPCAPQGKILVFRETAAFCGPCLWAQKHTDEIVPPELASRVELVDLIISDENNLRVRTSEDLARVERALGGHAPIVAADPDYLLQTVGLGDRRLPFYVMVDSRTMQVRRFLPDPEPENLVSAIRREVAVMDGKTPPPLAEVAYEDGLFPRNHWDMLKEMTLPGPPPPDPTNAVADSPAAAALGKELFSDVRLSPSGKVSCGTCHVPEKGFADGLPRGVGVAEGDRNTPSILYASHARFQFWDGRADTLWLQATGPIENPGEMGSDRTFVARQVFAYYKDKYEAVFPGKPLPPLSDAARFPTSAKPGDAAWNAMTAQDRAAVSQVFVGVAKAIEAFERTLSAKPNALDRYIAGDRSALDETQKSGLHNFFTAGCAQCHYGPRLTDDAFHNIRFPTGRQDGKPDLGAAVGLPALLTHEFRKPEYADGPFREIVIPKDAPELVGAFRTPPLRGTPATAPYGHGGNVTTLDELAKHYGNAGLADDDPRTIGKTEGWVPNFTEEHRKALVPALRMLTGEIAP